MALLKVWIHAVWATKHRYPFLIPEIKDKLIQHILENAASKQIRIDAINGHLDHLHALIAVRPDKTIAETMQLIKGEAAYWMNKQQLTKLKFEWAVGYYAGSVSEDHLPRVRGYIRKQEQHHAITTFREDYERFLRECVAA